MRACRRVGERKGEDEDEEEEDALTFQPLHRKGLKLGQRDVLIGGRAIQLKTVPILGLRLTNQLLPPADAAA